MSYVSHDGLAYFKHKLDQKFISNITSENGALKIILGDGTVLKSIQDTTVTQKKSTANELYPLLLCYDAMADQDQLSKETWFGQHILANPYYGYLASRGMYVKHPTFNRRNGVSQKVEWAYDFTDAVSGLGNPMSQVYAYVDPASEGGEHCIELRLYGNPNVSPTVPSINDSTNTFSIGVGVTGGNVKFGYCPSTPLYLDNGSTLRTEATGHGNDIITRDWLNLNGSLTGLVHTTMNETIDGAKTFKKTVTINSGDNNNKAGLYVQGNSDVHGNEHVYGTETVDGKLTVNGTAEIKGGSGNNPSLLVTGNETVTGKLTGTGTAEFSGGSGNIPTLTVNGNESVSGNSSVGGNSSITGNETVGGNISTTNGNISTTNGTVSGKTGSIGTGGLTVAGNETVSGKITGNNGAEISGGNGLVVNGNETVNGEIYKVVNNTPQEYVSYVTNKQETKTTIVNNLIKDKGGLAVDSNKNIYVNTGKGLNLDSAGKINVDFSQLPAQDVTNIITGMVAPGSGLVADNSTGKLAVDFSQMPTDKFEALLKGLKMQIPLEANITFYVDKNHANASNTLDDNRGTANKPFKTIQACINYVTQTYAFGIYNCYILIKEGVYEESLTLPEFTRSTGSITLRGYSQNKNVTVFSHSGSTTLSCNGGLWYVDFMYFKHEIASTVSQYGKVESCVSIYNGSLAHLSGNKYEIVFPNDYNNENNYYHEIRIINVDANSTLYIHPATVSTEIVSDTREHALVNVLAIMRSANLFFVAYNGPDNSVITEYPCTGSASRFCECSSKGSVSTVDSGRYSHFYAVSEFTGKRYQCTSGGTIQAGSGYNGEFFPGTIEGTVDANTYCWYKD